MDTVLRKTLEEFQASRQVELRTSDRVHVPTAIGFFKPAIILPAWVIKELPIEQVHALLLHELAHLQRGDDWTNLIQKLLRAILFFHPAVWWIDSRLALEREMACDDIVLAQSANRRDYAHSLVSVAEKSFFRRGLALAQAAVSRMRHVSMRVKQILGAPRARIEPPVETGIEPGRCVVGGVCGLAARAEVDCIRGFGLERAGGCCARTQRDGDSIGKNRRCDIRGCTKCLASARDSCCIQGSHWTPDFSTEGLAVAPIEFGGIETRGRTGRAER